MANHTRQHGVTLPPTRCHTAAALQHTQHRNACSQRCDTDHRHNVGVSPYIALLQNSEKLRNEMYLRSSTCIFVFRSFVLFVYVITKHPANTTCDLQRCVSYFLRIFTAPRDRQPPPSRRLCSVVRHCCKSKMSLHFGRLATPQRSIPCVPQPPRNRAVATLYGQIVIVL